MRFILCEKQFLYLNTDADAVNTDMSMPIFPSGQHELLRNSFFQHDSKLKSGCHLSKKMCCLLDWKPFENDEKCFLLKAPYVLKIFKFLSRHFGHVAKTAWLER